MAISWLNKSSLEVGDLYMIHGLLCQEEKGSLYSVDAPPSLFWSARVELEWGVPVVVISKATGKYNWRGKYICEESRIALDTLANRIDDLSKTFCEYSVSFFPTSSDYERLLGLDVQIKLKEFESEAKLTLRTSWISRLLSSIRSCCCFSSIKRDSIESMESNFRRYAPPNHSDGPKFVPLESVKERAQEYFRGCIVGNNILSKVVS